MIKPTVKRGLMLDFLPDKIRDENQVNSKRIFSLNQHEIKQGDIVYLSTRELRLEDNWALLYGLELAKKHNKKLKVIVILSKILYSNIQEKFLLQGINLFRENCINNGLDFQILEHLPTNVGALITDFNPINKNIYNNNDFPIFEVDSHNIIPARYVSDKQEFSAATLRRKIYANIAEFLTSFPDVEIVNKSAAYNLLNNFTATKLDLYSEHKNDTKNDVSSMLSPHLTFGFISSQRVALEILKSNSERTNKEAFLEEIIIRKELADNFCLYAPSFNTFDGILDWAKNTLNEHRSDIRSYLYSKQEFETARTHDELWNKIQNGLVKTNRIHSYPRMYWAKKILEWSKSPEEALDIAIYLNDNYALDGNNPNGYVGILWSIGGLHDRPFTNRFVSGKIRYMKGDRIKLD